MLRRAGPERSRCNAGRDHDRRWRDEDELKRPGAEDARAEGSRTSSPTSTTTCATGACCHWSRWSLVAIVAVPFLLGAAPKPKQLPAACRRRRGEPDAGEGLEADRGRGHAGLARLPQAVARPLGDRSLRAALHRAGRRCAASSSWREGRLGSPSSTSRETRSRPTTRRRSTEADGSSPRRGVRRTARPGPAAAASGEGLRSSPSPSTSKTSAETTADGSQKMSEPEIRHDVLSPAPLPGEKAPGRHLRWASTRRPGSRSSWSPTTVTSVTAKSTASPAPETCQLLEVEPDSR